MVRLCSGGGSAVSLLLPGMVVLALMADLARAAHVMRGK